MVLVVPQQPLSSSTHLIQLLRSQHPSRCHHPFPVSQFKTEGSTVFCFHRLGPKRLQILQLTSSWMLFLHEPQGSMNVQGLLTSSLPGGSLVVHLVQHSSVWSVLTVDKASSILSSSPTPSLFCSVGSSGPTAPARRGTRKSWTLLHRCLPLWVFCTLAHVS